jgi:hypothetical protein
MELHFEVIRGKEAIYSELLQSKSSFYQLAICYRNDNNLYVKICNVTDIADGIDDVAVTLRSEPGDNGSEVVIGLNSIESIYPIHPYRK